MIYRLTIIGCCFVVYHGCRDIPRNHIGLRRKLEMNQMTEALAPLKKKLEEDKAWRKYKRYGNK